MTQEGAHTEKQNFEKQEPQAIKTRPAITTNAAAPFAATGHYPCRIPVRMTVAERAAIGRSACAADQSVSRYLVELATKGRASGPEDKVRLRYLRALLRDGAEKIEILLNSPILSSGDREIAQVRGHLADAGKLLVSLSLEVGRRLDGDGL